MTPNEMFERNTQRIVDGLQKVDWSLGKTGFIDFSKEQKQFLLDLKELMRGIVPEEDDGYKSDCKTFIDQAVRWNACRSEILRRIEDVK